MTPSGAKYVRHQATKNVLATHFRQFVNNGDRYSWMCTGKSENDPIAAFETLLSQWATRGISMDIFWLLRNMTCSNHFVGHEEREWRASTTRADFKNKGRVCHFRLLWSLDHAIWDTFLPYSQKWKKVVSTFSETFCTFFWLKHLTTAVFHDQPNGLQSDTAETPLNKYVFTSLRPKVTAHFYTAAHTFENTQILLSTIISKFTLFLWTYPLGPKTSWGPSGPPTGAKQKALHFILKAGLFHCIAMTPLKTTKD